MYTSLVKYLVLELLLIISCILAAPYVVAAQEFNEEQTAYNEAIRIVLERGCVPKFARTKPYTVEADATKVRIVAKEVAQECKVKVLVYVITWKAPTLDVNNKALPANGINSYEIASNGRQLCKTSALSCTVTDLKSGDLVSFIAVGHTGLRSQPAVELVP